MFSIVLIHCCSIFTSPWDKQRPKDGDKWDWIKLVFIMFSFYPLPYLQLISAECFELSFSLISAMAQPLDVMSWSNLLEGFGLAEGRNLYLLTTFVWQDHKWLQPSTACNLYFNEVCFGLQGESVGLWFRSSCDFPAWLTKFLSAVCLCNKYKPM